MNALVLWLPGAALIIVGALLLGLQQLEMAPALVLVGIGAVLETVGVVLWVRQRRTRR